VNQVRNDDNPSSHPAHFRKLVKQTEDDYNIWQADHETYFNDISVLKHSIERAIKNAAKFFLPLSPEDMQTFLNTIDIPVLELAFHDAFNEARVALGMQVP
jgi:hypothetical protein